MFMKNNNDFFSFIDAAEVGSVLIKISVLTVNSPGHAFHPTLVRLSDSRPRLDSKKGSRQ